jgi:hypothetical protein
LNLLEPIKFVEGEGGWQVRLDAYGRAEVVRVLNRSLDIDVMAAMRIIRKLPRVLVREATEEHALELVNRLRRAGATAEAIPPAD